MDSSLEKDGSKKEGVTRRRRVVTDTSRRTSVTSEDENADSEKPKPSVRKLKLKKQEILRRKSLEKSEGEIEVVEKKIVDESPKEEIKEQEIKQDEDVDMDFWTQLGSVTDLKRSKSVEPTVRSSDIEFEESAVFKNYSLPETPINDNDEEETIPAEKSLETWCEFYKTAKEEYSIFKTSKEYVYQEILHLRNKCIGEFILVVLLCGFGGFMFRYTEGAFEVFYKCGVKRVKRDFVEELWRGSQFMREDEWKSKARRKLMEFEEQLHEAFEAGMNSYSGQKSWSFLNAVLYCFTLITTIGYGHIAPSTASGQILTIVYAVFGIPIFLIVLADFGKLFTRMIKWVWAFVRRLYYTGSCRKVRRTAGVQEMVKGATKGVQIVKDIAAFRRPSMFVSGEIPQDSEQQENTCADYTPTPSTPAPAAFVIDDEFNLPISVAITILLIYILCGATLFWIWEMDDQQWTFFQSFYFVFISMSTIGLGDFVPQDKMYMMASTVYLIFGLALTSMCINVVQEKLSDTFRQASAKIGATIGLKVNEADGTITPLSPPQVEVVDVHKASSPGTAC